ncbi:MAG: RluA family pseudouridine synthase [Arenicella sp.]
MSSVSFQTIDESNSGQRLDNFLLKVLKGVPKTYIYRIIRKGEVRVNKKRAQASTRLKDGDIVRIPPVRVSQPKELDDKSVARHSYLLDGILYEDNDVLVLNKPSGLAVHSGSGLQFGVIELLRELTNYKFLELVHRLDRATSGCLLLAKKRSVLTELSAAFANNNQKNNLLDKRYKALVMNGLESPSKMVIAPVSKRAMSAGEHKMVVVEEDQLEQSPGVQFAKTKFHTIETFQYKKQSMSLLEAKLFTGRTHQVRVHAAHVGCQLLGDEKYGDYQCNKLMQSAGLNRLFLHASQLRFPHPIKKENITVTAPLPKELDAVLKKIRQN